MTPFAMLPTVAMIGQTQPRQAPTYMGVGTSDASATGENAFLLRDPIWLKDFLIAAKDANQGGEGSVARAQSDDRRSQAHDSARRP